MKPIERGEFNPKQLKAIQLLAQPGDKKFEVIAEEVGIDAATLWRWRRVDAFQQAINDLSYSCLKDELPRVYKSLADKAIGGNVKAIEIILKFADNFVERSETSIKADIELGGATDEEINRQLAEQERILGITKGKE